MTFRSNAAECERDQLGTSTSAGRDRAFVEVSPQPLSSSGARQALRQSSHEGSHLNDISGHGACKCQGFWSSVCRHLHLLLIKKLDTVVSYVSIRPRIRHLLILL